MSYMEYSCHTHLVHENNAIIISDDVIHSCGLCIASPPLLLHCLSALALKHASQDKYDVNIIVLVYNVHVLESRISLYLDLTFVNCTTCTVYIHVRILHTSVCYMLFTSTVM